MKSDLFSKIASFLSMAAVAFGCLSCIDVDYQVGADLLGSNQQFDTYMAELDLTDISMQMVDSLSGYSQTRIAVGAIRDEVFGLTTRGCALTLVPFNDTLDFGKNAKFKNFYFNMGLDTVSLSSESQRHIIQNINVYELTEPIGTRYDLNMEIEHGSQRITQGIPVFDGEEDSVAFHFTREFGEKYMKILQEDTKDIETYTKKFPGIFINTDEPIGNGGRINLFKLQLGYNLSANSLTGNFAELSFEAEYDGAVKDTSFLFYFSPDQFYDVDSLLYYTSGKLPQHCLNITGQSTREKQGKAGEKIYVEGGGGLKPVISAKEIRDFMFEEISKHGDPNTAAINKASLQLPYIFPDDYKDMDKYPDVLSPTCRIKLEEGGYSYANLTDSSASDEDQGDINRSLNQYSPDITYHAQTLLRLDDKADISNYDIWFLIMANEVEVTSNSAAEQDELSEYYQNLMYASYYNNMYGGYGGYGGYGYGGYGYGYGGYGYGGYGYNSYSNYYSYALMQQYYNSSASTQTTTQELDKDRYYYATLRGPSDPEKRPKFKLTYSIPRE